MSLLLVSQRIPHIKVEYVLLPKHYTMKMYGGMEEAKLHTLILRHWIEVSGLVSCLSQGRVFWHLLARRLSKPCYQFRSSG